MDGNENGNGAGAQLSFLGCVNIAVRLVTEKYPEAKLYEVNTLAVQPGDPKVLKPLRAVFSAGDNTTAIIKGTAWGEFGPIEHIGQPWLEDVVIDWPISMDIIEADALLKAAGYTQPYGAITLRYPLYPGSNEPYYIFSMGGGVWVFVGVNDKKVTSHG